MTKLEKLKTYIEVKKELKENMMQTVREALREATKGNYHDEEYCELLEKSIEEYQVEITAYKKVLELFEIL